MELIVTPLDQITELLPFIIPLVLLQLTLMIVALVDLIRREKTRGLPKWAWALVIVLGELIGPIVYFIFGREE
jgi:Phospholipase_D-nuclease N-terminal